ncbi:MAG: TIGR02646 family protein [Gammaproteobacteria bacterium]|nr:TIGR02646 family protein [Gammaproteobacteria bacterium]
MRKINKGQEPESLTQWKRSKPVGNYQNITAKVRQDIRAACVVEQFYLCAYCCQSIAVDRAINEHVEARRIAPNRDLDFSNIVASCDDRNQCDNAHGSQPLPLTPFMRVCETELKFKISGRVEGLTDRARETIRVLNLGDKNGSNRGLIEKRKQLSEALLWSNSINPRDGLEDDDLLQRVIDDIQQPKNGKLESFAPVVVNILKSWLS